MNFMDTGLFWLSIGVVLFVMEMIAPGFVLFFFGLGAWVTALVNWFFPISVASQLFLFTAVSLLSLVIFRGLIKGKFFGNSEGADLIIEENDRAEVVEAIYPPHQGRVKYNGTLWQAQAEETIEVGEIVRLVRRNNLVIYVKK